MLPKPDIFTRIIDRIRVDYHKVFTIKTILKTNPIKTGKENFEFHILSCEKDFFISLWAIKSFYHFSNTRPRLVIHNDGSLTEQSKTRYQQHILGCRIVDREEADPKLDEALKPFPYCRKFRKEKEFYCSLKLFDYVHFCDTKHILHIDTDVIFFQKPIELLQYIEDGKLFFNRN